MKTIVFCVAFTIKYFLILVTCLIIVSCKSEIRKSEPEKVTVIDSLRTDLQPIFDSSKVVGSILVYDPQKHVYYSNDFKRSHTGFLPASTFKIPNSIIAIETGVVNDDSTLMVWDGEKRRLAIWERDLLFSGTHFIYHVFLVTRKSQEKLGLTGC